MEKSSFALIDEILENSGLKNKYKEEIVAATEAICKAFKSGNRLYVCGNGGSAADSEHIVGEFAKSFRKKRPADKTFAEKFLESFPEDGELIKRTETGFPAFSLVSQSGVMTAVNNDIGGDYVFSQQVYAYANAGDIFIGISTSGNSVPVCNAAKIAKVKGAKVIALVGKTGGDLKKLADICVLSEKQETYLVQQEHIVIYHAICAAVEEELI